MRLSAGFSEGGILMPFDQDQLTKARKRYSGAGWALFVTGLATLLTSGLATAAVLLVTRFYPANFLNNPLVMWLLGFGPVYLVGVPLGMLLLRSVPADRFTDSPMGAKNFFRYLVMCFGITFLGGIVGNLLAALFSLGAASNPLDDILMDVDFMTVLTMVVIAPVMEELLFRKLLLDRLTTFGERGAILFSALAFSLFHGNLYQIFYAFGIGVLFGYLYVRTRRIRYTVIMHAVINFLGSVVVPLVLSLSGDGELDFFSPDTLLPQVLKMLPMLLYQAVDLLLAATGTVLLIVFWKQARFRRGLDELPRKCQGRAIYGNVSVILFLVLCGIQTVLTLLQSIFYY